MTEVTWWGHATSTVQERGARVLFDPVLRARLAHLKRREGAIPHADVLIADVVAISHLHADHLHIPSLKALPRGTRVVGPKGCGPLFSALDLDLIEVTAGDLVPVAPGVDLEVTSAVHDHRRSPLSKLTAQPIGFVVVGDKRTYFPGDTELFVDMSHEIGHVDTALVPVGGWGPSLGEGHMGPAEGARMVEWLAPTLAIPVHWGTFWPAGLRGLREELFHRPGPRFVTEVAQRSPATRVEVLAHGETTRA